jgi:hypothetical protein
MSNRRIISPCNVIRGLIKVNASFAEEDEYTRLWDYVTKKHSPYLEYQKMTEHCGLVQTIGKKNFFWSSDQAIVEVERRKCKFCKNALR